MFTTGASDSFAQNNIYDLAGNLGEITLQQLANGTDGRVIRGGLAACEGTYNRANSHYSLNRTEYEQAKLLVGFRTMLIKDEGCGPENAATAPSYIPEGYTHVEGTTMSNGFVVKDSSGNEFVWVEVPRTSTVYPTAGVNITEFTQANYEKIETDLRSYTSSYGKSGYSDQYYSGNGFRNKTEYNKQKRKMLRSIYKNEGFYIGRYETGTTAARTSYSQQLTTPKIQKNLWPYANITIAQAQELSTQFASSGYSSSLIFGLQWDLTMKFLETTGIPQANLKTDSTYIGNYYNSEATVVIYGSETKIYGNWDTQQWSVIDSYYYKAKNTSIAFSTGAVDSFKLHNIYDLAGNAAEYSLEYYSSSKPTVYRGGWLNVTGSTLPAASKYAVDYDTASAFRTTLYKEEVEEPVIVDVVDPQWRAENIVTTLNASTGAMTTTMKLIGTDKYFKQSTLAKANITAGSGGTITNTTLTGPTSITETRDGQTVQVGVEYTLTITGTSALGNTMKINIAQGTMTDNYGNSSKSTDIPIDFTTATLGSLAMKLGSTSGSNYTNGSWTNQSVYVYASESSSSNTTTTYTINGSAAKASGSSNSTALTETSTNTATLIATDTSGTGNVTTITGYTIKIDKIDPVLAARPLEMKLGSVTGSDYSNDTFTKQDVYVYANDGTDANSGHNSTTYSVAKNGTATVTNKASGSANATKLTGTGTYTITVTTKDNANNSVTSSTYTVKIDQTNPTAGTMTFKNEDGTNYTPGDDNWTKQSVTLTLTNGTDTAGTVNSGHKSTTYTIDGVASTATSITAEGKHTIVVTTEDNVGNVSTNTYKVNIDKTVPTAGTMTLKNADGTTYTSGTNNWTKQTVNLTLANGTDALSGHKSTTYKIDGTTSTATSITAEGKHTIEITTTDKAGNTATRTYYANIDKTAPTWNYKSKDVYYSTPNDAGNDNYANQARTVLITFTGKDAYIGDTNNIVTSTLAVGDITISVNGTDVTSSVTKELTTTNNSSTEVTCVLKITGITGDGPLTVSIPSGKLSDVAGNQNNAKSLTTEIGITIDNTTPGLVLEVTGPGTGAYKAGQTITITATYNENIYKEVTSNTLIDTTGEAPAMTLKFGGVASKGTVSCTAVSGNVFTYTYAIQSGDNGLLTIGSLATVYDRAGNSKSASNVTPVGYTVHADTQRPTVSVSPSSKDWTKNAVSVTITQNDPQANSYASGLAATTGKYFLTTSDNPTATGTLESYTSGTAFSIKPATTGEYYLYVKAVKDNAQNQTTATNSVTIDGVTYHRYGLYKFDFTAPTPGTLTMTKEDGNAYTSNTWTNQSVSIVQVNGSDAHSGHNTTTYTVKKDGADYLSNKTGTTTLTDDGTYTITVKTTDVVGNSATNPTTYTVKIDKTDPVLADKPLEMKLGSVGGNDYTNNTWTKQDVYVYANAGSDALSGHKSTTYSVNGGAAKDAGSANYTKLTGTGTYTITVTTKDNANNSVTSSTYTVKIDQTNPVLADKPLEMKLGSVTGNNYTNDTWTKQDVYVYANAGTDANSGHKSTTYTVYKDGTPTVTNKASGSGNATKLTGTGIYTITVTTKDNVENSVTSSTYTVKIDQTNPVLAATPLVMKLGSVTGSNYTNDTWTKQDVYVYANAGTDAHSGHKSTTYSVAKNGTATVTNKASGSENATQLTGTGTYTITVTTKDNVDNSVTSSTYTVKIDQTNPVLATTPLEMKLGSVTGDNYTNNTWTAQDVYVYANAGTDAHSGHQSTTYSVDGGTAKASGSANATKLTGTGIYTITVTTTDNVNNSVTSSTYTVKIDQTAPTKPIYTPFHPADNAPYESGTWTNYLVHTTIRSNDPQSGVVRIQYSTDRTNWTTFSFSASGGLKGTNAPECYGTEPWNLRERNNTYYFRAVDAVGNISELSDTYTIKYDLKAPKITLNPTTGTDIIQSHTVTVTLSDNNGTSFISGLAAGAQIQYGWSTSADTAPESYATASLSYSAGDTSTSFTATTPNSTGTYYLWVVPTTLKDVAGNVNSTTVISELFHVDVTAPRITISPQEGPTIKQSHDVIIAIADNITTPYSGLAEGATIQYGWAELNADGTVKTAPTYRDATVSYSGGAAGASVTVSTPSVTGIYALYINAGASDRAGNSTTETIQSGAFYVDVTAPTVTISPTQNTTWAKSHTTTVTLADDGTTPYSGLATGAVVEYGWSTSNSTAPSYTRASLTYNSGAGKTTFTATTPNTTGKYYLWVKPTTLKDVAGNTTSTTPVIVGEFWVDVTAPVWTVENISKTNPTVTMDIIGTDANSGYASNSLDIGDITVIVDGETASSITKTLTLVEDVPGTRVKYTLTLSGWQQGSLQDGKTWTEWSGTTSIVIAADTLTDNAGNTNSSKTASLGLVDFIRPVIKTGSSSGNTIKFTVHDKYIDTTDQITKDEITAIYIDGVKVDSITKDSLTRTEITGTVNGTSKVVGYTYTLTLGNINQAKSAIIEANNIGSASYDDGRAYGQYTEYSGTVQIDIAEGATKDTSNNGNSAKSKMTTHFVDSIAPNVTYKYMGVSRADGHESASANPDVDYENNTFRMIFDITDKYFNTSTGTLTTSMTKAQILQYLTIKVGNINIADIDTKMSDPDFEISIEAVEDVYTYGTIKKTVNGSIQSVTATSSDTTIKNAAKIGKRYTLKITNFEQTFRNETGYADYSGIVTVALKSGLAKDSSGRSNSAKTITSGVNLAEGNNAGGSSKVIDVVNPIITRTASAVDEANRTVTMGLISTDKYFNTSDTITSAELSIWINGVKCQDAVITVSEETAKLTDENGNVYGEAYIVTASNLPTDMAGLKVRVKEGAIYDQYRNPNFEIDLGLDSYLMCVEDETESNSPFLNNRRGVTRDNIEKVIFEASTAGMDHATKWDVSDQQDESIWAWTTIDATTGNYIVHIASDYGTINANPNSSYLFSWVGTNSSSAKVIENLEYLQIGGVTNMNYMFSNFAYGNPNMTEFYLGESFDTTLVENMAGMFQNCGYTGMKSLDLGDQFLVDNVEDMSNMFNGCGGTAMTSLDLGQSFTQIPNTSLTDRNGNEYNGYDNFATNAGKTGECIIYAPEAIYSNKTTFRASGETVSYTNGTIKPIYSPIWEKVSSTLTDDGVMTVIVKGHAIKEFDIGNSLTDTQTFYKSPIRHYSLEASNIVAFVDGEKATEVTVDSVELVDGSVKTGTFTVVDDDGNFEEVSGTSEVQYKITLSNFDTYTKSGKRFPEWSGNVSLQIARGTLRDYYGNYNATDTRAIDPTQTDRETDGIMFIDDVKPIIEWISASKDASTKTQTIVFDVLDKYIDTSTDAVKILRDEITVYVDGELASNVTKSISRSNLTRTINGATQVVGQRYTLTLSNFVRAMNSKGYQDWSGTVSLDIAANAAVDKSGNASDAVTGMSGTYSDFVAPAIKYTHSASDISGKVYTMTFTVTDKYYDASATTQFTTADITNGNITVLMQNGQRDASGNLIVYNLKDLASKGVTMEITSTEKKATSMSMTTDTTNLTVGTVSNQLIGRTYKLVITGLDQAFIAEGATTANYSGVIMVSLPANRIADTSGNKNVAQTITSGINIAGNSTSGSPSEIDVVSPIVQKISSTINPLSGTATVKIRVTDTYFKSSDALVESEIKLIVNGTEVTSGLTKTIGTPTPLKETRYKNDGLKADGTPETETEEVQYGAEYTFTVSGFSRVANQVKVQIVSGAFTDNTGNGNGSETYMLYNALKTVGDSVYTPENLGTSPFLGIAAIQRQDIENVTFLPKIPKSGDAETYGVTFTGGKVVVDDTNVWDVSAQGDDTIVAWYTTNANGAHTVYIASDEAIIANRDSGYLFAHIANSSKCTAERVITNLELLNTASVTSMFAMFYDMGNQAMTILDLGDNFYTSNVTTMRSMFLQCGQKKMTAIYFGPHFDTSKVTTMFQMFKLCGTGAMTSLNLKEYVNAEGETVSINFDTSNVETMYAMFNECGTGAMTTFNLGENFDTTNVEDMSYMFYRCGKSALTSLNLGSSFNTAKVKDMSYMFYNCGYTAMTTLTLGSNFIASAAEDMSYMFSGCGYTKMTSLSLGNQFNAQVATNMSYMFERCGYTAMTTLNLGTNFNSIAAQDMSYMFSDCGNKAMTTLTLGDKFIASAATNVIYMFNNCGYTKLPSLTLGSGFSVSAATDLSYMFKNCGYTAMTTLNLGSNFNASSATTLTGMFEGTGYTLMTELNLGANFNLSVATDLSYMFQNCGYTAMSTLDLGANFNSVSATNMSHMFDSCGYKALTQIKYGEKFITTNVTNMSYMFKNVARETATEFTFTLPSNFNTNKVTNMKGMFFGLGYTAMTTFNLNNGFNTENVTNMVEIFKEMGHKKLKVIDLGAEGVNFDTTKVTDMTDFFNCTATSKLQTLNLGPNFNTINVTSMRNMFYRCGGSSAAIKEFSLGDKFDTSKVKYFRSMFNAAFGENLKVLDLGDKFYTTSVVQNHANAMNRMFMGCQMLRVLDLGPHFTITSAPTDGDTIGDFSSACTIYAPESVYASEHVFKLNKEDTTTAKASLTVAARINPIYKPEWTKESVTLDTTNKTVEIKLKGSAYRVEDRVYKHSSTQEYPYKINYVSDIESYSDSLTSLVNASRVYIDGVDVTETTKPTITKTVNMTTQTNATSGKTEVVGYTLKLSNLEEAVRQTGVPFKEWSGNISVHIDGRGESSETYSMNVLVDEYGNQSMGQVQENGTWIDVVFKDGEVVQNTANTMFADFIKPEFTYQKTDRVIGNGVNGDKKLKVTFDVVDEFFNNTTLVSKANDITITMLDDATAAVNTAVSKQVTAKNLIVMASDGTVSYKATNYTLKSGETKIGERYELEIGNLEQNPNDGFNYSGPMSITFPSGIVKDKSDNGNATTTITIGIDENDGNNGSTGDNETGNQEIVDVVDPIWTVGESYTNTVDGVTSAYIKMIVSDKYFQDSTLDEMQDQIVVKIAGESKTMEEVGATLIGPTDTTNGHIYEISLEAFEETYAEFLAQRALYNADNTKGRTHREFGGTLEVIVPKGAAVDQYGNDSEQLTVDLGTIDTLKPEVVKVSSSIQIVENPDNPNDISASKYTVVFDITDKFYATSGISTTDTSKIHVLFDGEEAESVTKTIKNIQELKSTINAQSVTVGYRYTLEVTNFKDVKAASDAYTDWSGNISIQIDEGAATDSHSWKNATTILPAEAQTTPTGQNRPVDTNAEQADYIDTINPDVTYIFSETDIDYTGKSFKMEFEITDKYFSNSTLELENLTIKIDVEDGTGFQDFNQYVTKTLTSVDVKTTVDGVANTVVGKRYTLQLGNLEQDDIQYSGIVAVVIPGGVAFDSTRGTTDTKQLYNNGTTLTSGIDVIGDIINPDDSSEVIDIVDPIWEKVSSSANAIDKTATITMKGTDKYYASCDLTGKVEVYVNGSKYTTNSSNFTISEATPIYKDATNTKQIGEQYTFTITGFDQDVSQVKIRILAGAMLDTANNGNKVTDGIAYNTLKSAATETSPNFATNGESSVFLGGNVQRRHIEKVKFVQLTRLQMSNWSSLIGNDETYWDVSAKADKSIVAHYTDANANGAYEVEIGSYWEMFANQNSSYLLSFVGYGEDCEATEPIVNLDLLNTNSVTNMSYMFNNFGYRKMTALNLGDFDTADVTNMSNMFNGCGELAMTTFNLGTMFDTTKVTDMSGMFQNCGRVGITTLDLGATGLTFNTSNVENMSNMFNGQSAITTFSFGSNFNTSKVKNMSGMFQNFGHSLTTLDLGATGVTFDTSKVENMSNMFNGCGATAMTTLKLGNNFETKLVRDMSGMFQGFAQNSSAMKHLDLGNKFYTTAVTNMSNMFNACGASAMIILDLGPHFTNIPATRTDMFKDCGTATLVIYAPESIYETQTSFK